MRIIVDAYGGDNAPDAVLQGCRMAADRWKCEIILTGDEQKLRQRAAELSVSLEGIGIADAPDVIPVEAEPTAILKQYQQSSMARGLQMLANGEGEAFVSAGSTGALVVGGTLIVKRLKGVKRPAIGTVIPCRGGCFLLLDSGANHDCRPEMLRQFGLMGSVYMKRIIGVPNPRVGLVNIGTEETKGTELQVQAYQLMKEAGYNFIGNVEAREVPLGGCDVAVCDGFTGNILLKTLEGLAALFMGELKAIFMKSLPNKLAAAAVKKDIKGLKKQFDSAEYGGALLLGSRSPVIKAHGSSDAKAFYNAIRQAISCCENNIIGEIETQLAAQIEEN
ncbi:MAG: phosphate acyltransferase PlsX [Angelakisella sp.]|nr:phosphate acyltransferase PlsX [Angelakisella sp.]